MLEKSVGDLITPDTKILESGKVIGTLKKVTGWTEFSSNRTEQSGNYFPFTITATGTKTTLKRNGSDYKIIPVDDREVVLRIADKNVKWSVDIDGEEKFKLDFTSVNLA